MARRMGIYLLGVLILAVGNTLSTRAQLGVSPIISPAYAISEIWHIDFGAATMGVYMVFMAVQFILQGRRTRKLDLLEIPFSLVFSFLLNFFTAGFDRLAVPLGLDTPALWQKILLLAGSVVCTGVGAAMIVAMDLVTSPPDGMARAAGMAMGKGLGLAKTRWTWPASSSRCPCACSPPAMWWASAWALWRPWWPSAGAWPCSTGWLWSPCGRRRGCGPPALPGPSAA